VLSMRPRQPFDFAGRTGTIAFNVDAITEGNLSWWTSMFLTDDPAVAANNSTQVMGLLPRNGLGVNFDDPCGTSAGKVRVSDVYVYRDYVETKVTNPNPACVATRRGSLNHIEIRVSQTNVEVWASDFSTDGGQTFPNFQRILSVPISLSISRGYVHFQQAERAPVKYTDLWNISPGYAANYWSNLAFDGPTISTEHGYPVSDSLSVNPNGVTNIGYGLLTSPYAIFACCNGTTQIPINLSVPNVDLNGVTSAQLAFAINYTYANGATPANVALHYSLNGNPLRTPPQPNYTAEGACTGCPGPSGGNGVLFNITIPLTDLKPGTNTITLALDNTDNGWPPILSSLDLLTFH
jgi:hypothetical protein